MAKGRAAVLFYIDFRPGNFSPAGALASVRERMGFSGKSLEWRRGPAGLLTGLAVLLLLMAAGCGWIAGGSEDSGSDGAIELIDFGPEDPQEFQRTVQEKRVEVAQGFMLEPRTLGTVRFIYQHQVLLERLDNLLGDLDTLLEDTSSTEVDLEWVIKVHETTREADSLFVEIIDHDVPDYLEDDYGHMYLALLDVVKFVGVAVDRALAAGLEVGPSGRSLLAMTPEERARFRVLIRESRYYLAASQELLSEQVSQVGSVAGQMTFR